LQQPSGVAIDATTNTLYISSTGNHMIFTADLASGAVSLYVDSSAGISAP
jgi:hypothetical protein